jgi:hypothetical protein
MFVAVKIPTEQAGTKKGEKYMIQKWAKMLMNVSETKTN